MKAYISIAFNHHDSSVAVAMDREALLVLEAERFFRIKKLGCSVKQMDKLIMAALNYVGCGIEDVSVWCLTTLNNLYIPEHLRYTPESEWREVKILGKKRKVLIVNHHFAHACSYYAFPINNALISSCDGGGDPGERTAFYIAKDNEIEKLPVDTSRMISAKFYDVASQYLYNALQSEGKFMALAALGRYREKYALYLKKGIPLLSNYPYKECFKYLDVNFKKIRGMGRNPSKRAIDFAATVQKIFESQRLADIKFVANKFKNFENILLVGGAALNIKLNSLIYHKFTSKKILIPPCCDDSGQSLGALLYYGAKYTGKRIKANLPFLGYGEKSFVNDKTINKVVKYLTNGEIVVWHYSKAEIGPRALGHRSFLAPATSIEIKKILSERIKSREKYRPLAPIILKECVDKWFHEPHNSPFMLFSSRAKKITKIKAPGCLHIDGTARIQTITKELNPIIFSILSKYYKNTGIPILLNTSLNIKDNPISNNSLDTISLGERIDYPIKIFINGKIMSTLFFAKSRRINPSINSGQVEK